MERVDLIHKNTSIFREIGPALDRHASKDVKVVVVANPANSMHTTSNLPAARSSFILGLFSDGLRMTVCACQCSELSDADAACAVDPEGELLGALLPAFLPSFLPPISATLLSLFSHSSVTLQSDPLGRFCDHARLPFAVGINAAGSQPRERTVCSVDQQKASGTCEPSEKR